MFAERALMTIVVIGPAILNGGLSTFLAFVLLGFSQAYVFMAFFRVYNLILRNLRIQLLSETEIKRIFCAILAIHIRSIVWLVPRIAVSTSDFKSIGTWREKTRSAAKGSGHAISQWLLYRPSLPERKR